VAGLGITIWAAAYRRCCSGWRLACAAPVTIKQFPVAGIPLLRIFAIGNPV
jgi:hypothetical protein